MLFQIRIRNIISNLLHLLESLIYERQNDTSTNCQKYLNKRLQIKYIDVKMPNIIIKEDFDFIQLIYAWDSLIIQQKDIILELELVIIRFQLNIKQNFQINQQV
ncbi:unnamed protein product [Paramecium sonneborni]|uniref:Uncharacterized protein n=1 Tax=Paramecium sonneborni TaxID=65129 RepID=A0A8S1K1H7_9CILI|nr:unnamed protein product [Paramecium sonneborni]